MKKAPVKKEKKPVKHDDGRLGNQFWKLRSKHGRDKLFASPALLWGAACEYFEWCDAHPWLKTDHKGKDATQVQEPTQRPYTVSGLCIYLGCHVKFLTEFRKNLTVEQKDFSEVVHAIYQIIVTMKYEGAAVGAFNANIIARDLGLTDKKDLSSSDGTMAPKPTIVVSDDKTAEELKKLIEKDEPKKK